MYKCPKNFGLKNTLNCKDWQKWGPRATTFEKLIVSIRRKSRCNLLTVCCFVRNVVYFLTWFYIIVCTYMFIYKLTRCHVRTAGFNSGSREHPHHSSPLYLPFIEIRTRRTRTCCLRDMGRPDKFKGMKRRRQEKIGLEGILYIVKYRIEKKETCKLCERYLQHAL